MIDQLTHRMLVNQITRGEISYEEWLALHEAGRNDTLKLGIYVSPQEYAKQYLSKSKQTLFTGAVPQKIPTLLDEIRELLAT